MNPSSAHKQSAVRAGYESLSGVLDDALNQAQAGKGHERHAQAQPFDQQPMQKLIDLYGSGFALGQAAKKMQEAQRLPYERARAELLGAINYAAGAVIALDRMHLDGLECINVSASFAIVPRPSDAPEWANGDGTAGIGCYPVWLGKDKYAHKYEPQNNTYQIGIGFAFKDQQITRTSFFADAVGHFSANDNMQTHTQNG